MFAETAVMNESAVFLQQSFELATIADTVFEQYPEVLAVFSEALFVQLEDDARAAALYSFASNPSR